MKFSDPRPRGLRFNNPGELFAISGWLWRGESGTEPDGFIRFEKPVWGIRAGMVLIQNLHYYHGINTIFDLIERWAMNRNEIAVRYIQFICDRLNCSPHQPMNFCNYAVPLAKAMIEFQNGSQPYPDAVIERAVILAHER